MKNLPSSKKGNRQIRYMVKSKAKDENFKNTFATSKLRDWLDFDNCGSCRCVAIWKKDGPRKEYEKRLLNWR